MHRARLAASGLDEAMLTAAEASARDACAAYDGPASTRLRLTITVSRDGAITSELERRLSSLDVPEGPTIAVVHVREAPVLPPGPAKPADRSAWDAAMHQARRLGARQAILADDDGLVIDGGTANLWLVMRGRLVTPPSPPAVPGVARAWLLEAASGLGLETSTEAVPVEDLGTAEELFLTNAFAGAVAVRGRGGPVTRSVRAAFDELWGRREGARTEV